MSILAAAILAALEDTVDASHTAIERFMVMAANGSAEVVTIKISRKVTDTGGNPARVREQGSRRHQRGNATRQTPRCRCRDCRGFICAGSTQRAEAEFE